MIIKPTKPFGNKKRFKIDSCTMNTYLKDSKDAGFAHYTYHISIDMMEYKIPSYLNDNRDNRDNLKGVSLPCKYLIEMK